MAKTPDTFDPDAYDADVRREDDVVQIEVPEDYAGEHRLDKYLTRFYPKASRTKIQRSIKKGHVRVNGQPAKKSATVEAGDRIVFRLIRKPPMQAEPEPIPLDVAYEDDDLLVVHKPVGMVVHPAPGHRSGTLVNALLHHVGGETVAADEGDDAADDESVGLSMVNALPESPNHPVVRPGIVHRLDKGTSGLLVVAKRDWVHRELAAQFKAHTVERRYRAIVWGHLDPPDGTLTGAIGRDPNRRQRMAVVPEEKGKPATTHYVTVEHLAHTSVVQFTLETGRTHQIRVHASHQNHPLFGDLKYGGDHIRYGQHGGSRKRFIERLIASLDRPALHAERLGFVHPRSNEALRFEADLPDDMQYVLRRLRRSEGA